MPSMRTVIIASALIIFEVALVIFAIQQPALGGALLAGSALVLTLWDRPRLAFIAWLIVFVSVPPWLGIDAAGFVPAISLIGVAILISTISRTGWRPARADVVILGLILVGGLGVAFAGSAQGLWLNMTLIWAIAYLTGKVLASQLDREFLVRTIVGFLTALAALAVIEFIFDWHPYVDLVVDSGQYETWAPIQERGGSARSEFSLGHSIALGAALASAVPFALSLRARLSARLLVLAVLGAGVITTFSRAGILAFAAGIVLSVLFLSTLNSAQKAWITVALAIGGALAWAASSETFETADREASSSTAYRSSLFDLVPYLVPLGRSPLAQFDETGRVFYGRFDSIDNAFLVLGLSSGWLVALIALVPLLVLIARAVTGRSSAPEVALITQYVMLFTVAPITQWQALVWLLAGMAAVWAKVPTSSAQTGRFVSSESARSPRASRVPVRSGAPRR